MPCLAPPRPRRPACAGCARGACPASLPIPAPRSIRTPAPPPRHCGASRNPQTGPMPAAARTPLPCQGRGRVTGQSCTTPGTIRAALACQGVGPNHYPPTPPLIKCILPSRYRPARGLAPPRVRASLSSTPPAPHPTSARRKPTVVSPFPPRHMVERGAGDGPKPHHTWHYLCGFGPSEGEARRTPTPCSLCALWLKSRPGRGPGGRSTHRYGQSGVNSRRGCQ